MKLLIVTGILTLSAACGLEKDRNAKTIITPLEAENCSFTQVEDEQRVFVCPNGCVLKVTDSGVIASTSC